MKNWLTILALMLSSTGIFVSIAREELRCRLGLSSMACALPITQMQPESNKNASPEPADIPSTPNQSAVSETEHDKSGQPLPGTAQLVETMEQVKATISSSPELSLPDTPTAETSTNLAPTTINSPSSKSKKVPLNAQETALDTAIINEPAPKKVEQRTNPIAPPALKNSRQNKMIPVTPVDGQPIPIIAPLQE